jgi:hypothetical protein
MMQMSAFIIPWFIFPWVETSGYTLTFAAQAIICTFGLIPVYLLLTKFGPDLRSSRPMYVKHVGGIDIEGSNGSSQQGDVDVEKVVIRNQK